MSFMRSRAVASATRRSTFIPGCSPPGYQLKTFTTAVGEPQGIYDVVCIGGGPAGLTLVNALASLESTSHLKIALVESQDLDLARSQDFSPGHFSNRVSSLTPVSISLLSQIGAWSHVDTSRVQQYEHMHVWDGLARRSSISFSKNASGPPIAYMTENQNLVKGLLRQLEKLPTVSMFDRSRVSSITLGQPNPTPESSPNLSTYPHIRLSTGATIAARLLVGADGLNSPVRSFANISTRGWNYERHGVVATLKLAPSQHDSFKVAFQRFLPSGPIAVLPLQGDFASLVWTTTPTFAAQLKSLSTKDLVAMINAALRLDLMDINYMHTMQTGQVDELAWRESVKAKSDKENHNSVLLPEIIDVQERSIASFPLRLRHADTYTSSRVALIGDAAHSIHPLAGQGLNMGLADSKSLVNTVAYSVQRGGDIGESWCLDRYGSEMWMANNRLLGVCDKLHKLYSTTSAPVVGLRGLGLSAIDRFDGLKSWLMRQAGGVGA